MPLTPVADGRGVLLWWLLLCSVASLNILAWTFSAATRKRGRGRLSMDEEKVYRLQLVLSAAYVFGCAFRSVLPVFDIPRLCLFNTWLSSVLVGRSVATLAELSFAGQWALILREAAPITQSTLTWTASRVLVPLIVIAEVCSWYSVLTTSNIGHVIEESIWAFSAALFVASLATTAPQCRAPHRALFIALCVAGVTYFTYLVLADVPMYWARWISDQANGRHYLSILQGVSDASARRVVSYRWKDWHTEMVWMSLYFSVGAWVSISLIHAATLGRGSRAIRNPTQAYTLLGTPKRTLESWVPHKGTAPNGP